MLKLISAISLNGVIGKRGKPVFSIREDLQHFRQLTTRSSVIMGANTFIKDLECKPLKNRVNIVLSGTIRPKSFSTESWAFSIDEALTLARDTKDTWVIGGASVYRQFLPFVEEMHITHVNQAVIGDTYFPPIDWKEWELTKSPDYRDGFSFCTYARKEVS